MSSSAFSRLHESIASAINTANEDWHRGSWRDIDSDEGQRRYDSRARRRFAILGVIADVEAAAMSCGVSLTESESRLLPLEQAYHDLVYWDVSLPADPSDVAVRDRLAGRIGALQLAEQPVIRMAAVVRSATASAVEAAISEEPEGDVFRFVRGEHGYLIEGFGERGHLPELKGLGMIRRLLSTPGVEVPMLDLASADSRCRNDRHSSQPVYDADGMADIRRHCEDLSEDLERARRSGNEIEEREVLADMERLADRVKADTGLGGRPRNLNSMTDRLRTRLRGQLDTVCKKLRSADPPMTAIADHLKVAIASQGGFMIYHEVIPGLRWVTD